MGTGDPDLDLAIAENDRLNLEYRRSPSSTQREIGVANRCLGKDLDHIVKALAWGTAVSGIYPCPVRPALHHHLQLFSWLAGFQLFVSCSTTL